MGRLGLLGCLGALVLVLLIGGGWFVGVRNHLVELDQQVQAQWAQVENDYQRRFDLIPNLVRTVQGAANFEKSTLEAVINARARVGQVQAPAGGLRARSRICRTIRTRWRSSRGAQENLSGALSRLLVVVERYPDLKSNQNFLELQSQLEGTENRIAVERRRYNEVAQTFNASVLQVPGEHRREHERLQAEGVLQGRGRARRTRPRSTSTSARLPPPQERDERPPQRDRVHRDRAPRLGRAGAGHPAQADAVGERLRREPAQRVADSAAEREAGGVLQDRPAFSS